MNKTRVIIEIRDGDEGMASRCEQTSTDVEGSLPVGMVTLGMDVANAILSVAHGCKGSIRDLVNALEESLDSALIEDDEIRARVAEQKGKVNR